MMWILLAVLFPTIAFAFVFLWMRRGMEESFKALSFELMERNAKSFLDLAEMHLSKYQEGAKADLEGKQKSIEAALEPIKAAMKQLDSQQRDLDRQRVGAYAGLQKQLEQMIDSDRELRKETSQLASSLRSPQKSGSWGQMHLRRAVELAGLVNQCDFFEQVTIQTDGKIQRPDLVVRLPGERYIVVDAKTPLSAFLESAEIHDEVLKHVKLLEHVNTLRKHIKDLSSKEYWKALDLSIDYVILFLPAESFYSVALQADPTLIEAGVDQNVIIATPTTLIAILRAIAFSWKQESLSKSAKEISRLGSELYDRLGLVSDHWGKVGRQLNTVVDSYNQAVASLESRVLITAKKLKESSGITKDIAKLPAIDIAAKIPDLKIND